MLIGKKKSERERVCLPEVERERVEECVREKIEELVLDLVAIECRCEASEDLCPLKVDRGSVNSDVFILCEKTHHSSKSPISGSPLASPSR